MPTMEGDLTVGIDAELGADLATTALALARRFSRGATLWCLAPSWPEHARHIAVEFVHPVIVGKRALPAVSVDGADPIATVRAGARPGDVLIAVSGGDDGVVADGLRRARAWGVTTISLGGGRRPPPGHADHVLWVDGDDGLLAHDGRLVLLYHVLWELTHVCLEHAGLLDAADEAPVEGVCITCADEGRIAEVTIGGDGIVRVRTAHGEETVDVSILGAVHEGELVLVHAGTAIERLDRS